MQSGLMNILIDESWGSSGKGKVSAYLADKYKARYVSSSNFPNAGHCQTAETYVITNNGLERLGDVVKSSSAAKIVNMDGGFEEVSHFIPDGVRKTNLIGLKNGVFLECTDQHKYFVWDAELGQRVWVSSMDLDENVHQFIIPKKIEFTNNSLLPREFSSEFRPNKTDICLPKSEESFAEYLGLLVGDGYYGKSTRIDIAFNSKQLDTLEKIQILYSEMGITNPHVCQVGTKECFVLTTSKVSALWDLLRIVGLKQAIRDNKETPKRILGSNPKVVAAYLRGLFDSDGCAKKDRITLANCAESVIKDAQQLLYILGIHSAVTKYEDKPGRTGSNRLPQWTLSVSGKTNMEVFKSVVGFMSHYKNKRLEECIQNTQNQGQIIKISSRIRSISRIYGICTGEKGNTRTSHVISKAAEIKNVEVLSELLSVATNYHMVSIKSIKREHREVEVFDITVPGTHSYMANGVVSHNTMITSEGYKFIAKAIPTALGLVECMGRDMVGFISPGSGFFPAQLFKEWVQTGKPRLFIHSRASIVTPDHARREREGHESTKHIASTMQGSGTAIADKVLRKADCHLAGTVNISEWDLGPEMLSNDQKAEFLEKVKVVDAHEFRDMTHAILSTDGMWLHEGSQGYALSIDHGTHYPACTSRNCTVQAAMDHMAVQPQKIGDVYLNMRSFPIRVGNVIENGQQLGYSGDFLPDQKELTWEEIAEISGMPEEEAKALTERERTTVTRRVRRVATRSDALLKDAVRVNGVTKLSMNFVQYWNWNDAGIKGGKEAFAKLSKETRTQLDHIEELMGIPVTLIGTGANHDEIIDLDL